VDAEKVKSGVFLLAGAKLRIKQSMGHPANPSLPGKWLLNDARLFLIVVYIVTNKYV